MVYRLRQLLGLHIKASDGEVGKIKDVYFDDHSWTARYLVVETGAFLAHRQVLLSPIAVSAIDWDNSVVHVKLDIAQVKASPPIDTDKPVSRQHEADYFDYYGYPYYWTDPALFGSATSLVSPTGPGPAERNASGVGNEAPFDPRLRSANEVTGYGLETTAEPMGHVEDFLLDSMTWAIRYLVVGTRNWIPGKHVVIPPAWIKEVNWDERVVRVDVSPDSVRHAPEYDSNVEFSRASETSLYRHYQRDAYWQ
jgi:sporulation protein YlmC with PRC-barrel domain